MNSSRRLLAVGTGQPVDGIYSLDPTCGSNRPLVVVLLCSYGSSSHDRMTHRDAPASGQRKSLDISENHEQIHGVAFMGRRHDSLEDVLAALDWA